MLKQFDSMWYGTLGKINTVKHHIDLVPNAKAVISRPYRAGPTARNEIYKEVRRVRDQYFIDPAQFEWASLVVLARNSDGSWRFFTDYRRFNARTTLDT